jgi:branched-chain amino acid aminotransferase
VAETRKPEYAFFGGQIVPFEEAKVSVMTHGLNYGTGVFEGIRGYWNDEKEEIYLFRVREHYKRFLKNTRMLFFDIPYSAEELTEITLKLARMQSFREDVYIRPLAYKSAEQIGVSMTGVPDALTIFISPMGNYVDIDRGLSLCVSTWRRTDDNAIPGRAKATGNYINSALAKNEAVMNGYDEAIVLNKDGYVVESSASNIFLVRNGVLVTPSVADGILEGITRDTVIQLAAEELGISHQERQVARTELYYAEEIFLAGTGVQIAPVTQVDKVTIADGQMGQISMELQRLYFNVAKGRNPKYLDWLTPAGLSTGTPRKPVPAS